MKIILINQEHARFGGPGGAERSVQGLAEQYVNMGHRVTFVTTLRSTYTRDIDESGIHSIFYVNGVKTILLARKGNHTSYADLILPIVLEEKPDIVHTNVFHTVGNIWKSIYPTGIPIVHTLREYKLLCHRNMFDNGADCGLVQCLECARASDEIKHISSSVSGVIGISQYTLDRHLRAGFFSNAENMVIPNSFRPPFRVEKSLGFSSEKGKPTFGFFGRLHESKGILHLLSVISDLPSGTVNLLLAGDIQNDLVKNKISEAQERQNVEYLGFLEPEDFFQKIDVLVVPSLWHEPFGRVAIEALGHGVPVLSSKRGGLMDIVQPELNGWLYEPNDQDSLKDHLIEISEMTRDQMGKFSRNARDSSARFTPEKVGASYIDFYNQAIQSHQRPETKPALHMHHKNALRLNAERRLTLRRGTRRARPLKVVVVTGEFPKRSETFVLNHITGLIELGVNVGIAKTKNAADQIPQEVLEFELEKKTFQLFPDAIEERMIGIRSSEAKDLIRKLIASPAGQPPSKYDTRVAEALAATKSKMRDEISARRLIEFASDADVIHCHFGHRAKQVVELLRLSGKRIPVVCSFHGIDMSAHLKTYGSDHYRDILGKLNKALPVSHFFAKRLSALGFDEKDIQVHRVGVDLEKFTFSDRRRKDCDPLRLISVGRFVEKKGFSYSVQAVVRLLLERPDLRIEYTIIGDGDLRAELLELINSQGLSDKIRLVGAQSHLEVSQAMAMSHALIVPSITSEKGDMEGVPTVAMEAAASGLPVIATRHSGLPEVVLDGINGFLSDERDIEGIMKNILALYETPEIASKFGWAGRVHIEHEFNITRQNKKILDLYERIASGEDLRLAL